MKWRDAYNEKENAKCAEQCCIHFEGADAEKVTQDSFAREADINELVKRFGIVDEAIPPQALDPRFYGDVTGIPDLRTMLDRARAAEAAFMSLPAAVRSRFQNSAGRLWAFVSDPRNREEAVKLGLLAARPPVAAQAVPAAAPAADSGTSVT